MNQNEKLSLFTSGVSYANVFTERLFCLVRSKPPRGLEESWVMGVIRIVQPLVLLFLEVKLSEEYTTLYSSMLNIMMRSGTEQNKQCLSRVNLYLPDLGKTSRNSKPFDLIESEF